ncbi:pentatricopeptide repeat domain containing protein [Babesia divergens]|uniref:Pentatricopeptide repeat domain containing protein n=1 Tax=Babesia divergens TaxID=32595 RepID=A0AAD9G7U7_BABDI|nr:pentatricopeptide repeat domain containing protein [Babesia divergens]
MKMKIALSQEATLGIDFVKCIETLQTSPYCTVSPTTIAYNATLSAAERNSNARAALAVVEDMRKKGNVLDGVSYKLATITCAKCGYISEALQLYDEMLSKGHSADHGVMRALMAQLAKEGNGMDCFRIYEDMKKLEKVRQSDEKFMQPEDYLKFIEAATKSEMYAEALQAYKEMKTLKNYNVTPVVITEVLTLCYGAGSWKEAMELYALLLKEKTAMTLYQYKLLLNIMFISRKYAEMDSIYNNMYKEGVNMDYMSYQLVLEGYAKTGQFHKALKVIEKMEPEGFLHGRYEPFIAAAEACRQSGEWKLALKLLRMAHDHNTNKCIIMYNTVLSIFAAAEEWDSIISIYNEIEAACKESSGSLHKLSMDGDTVAYAIMASFYTGDKTQVDKLLRLPVVETTLLLKLRKNINAEENAVAPTEVEGTQG